MLQMPDWFTIFFDAVLYLADRVANFTYIITGRPTYA